MWKFRKRPDYALLGGYVGAAAFGIWLNNAVILQWPTLAPALQEFIRPHVLLLIFGVSLLVLALQTALLAWRIKKFPVAVWGILGILGHLAPDGLRRLIQTSFYPQLVESKSFSLTVDLSTDVLADAIRLLVVVVQAFVLATTFRRSQAWLYIGAAIAVVSVVQTSLWYSEVPVPPVFGVWIVPLLSALAAGLWLASADRMDDPIESATESPA